MTQGDRKPHRRYIEYTRHFDYNRRFPQLWEHAVEELVELKKGFSLLRNINNARYMFLTVLLDTKPKRGYTLVQQAARQADSALSRPVELG